MQSPTTDQESDERSQGNKYHNLCLSFRPQVSCSWFPLTNATRGHDILVDVVHNDQPLRAQRRERGRVEGRAKEAKEGYPAKATCFTFQYTFLFEKQLK